MHWFFCLFSAYKSKIVKPRGMTVLNCRHQPNVCKFLLVLEAQILDTAFSSGVEKCRSKRSAFSQHWGLHFVPPLPSSPFHHSSSVNYSMLNQCKKSYIIDHSSCIYHPFIYRIINLFIWAVYSALWVIYSRSSRWEWWSILGYLFCVHSIGVSCVIFVIHLITPYMCKFDMIVYRVIIERIFHPLIFVLLWLNLMNVKLQLRKYLQVKS